MTRRKRVAVSLLLAWSGMVALMGCGSGGAGGASTSGAATGSTGAAPGAGSAASAVSKDPIKLGVLVSETGSASWLGEPEIKGAKLAAEEINAKGGIDGRKVELVIHNDESTPEKAVIGAKRLVEQDKVVAIIGTSLVATSKAISPLLKEKGPIAYSLSAGYPPEHEYMFAGSVHTEFMQETIMDWFKDKGFKKVALLATTDSTGQVAVDAIKQVAPRAGVEVVALERMNTNDVDVTPQLTRIRSAQPDAMIAWLTGKPAGVVVKNVYQLDLTFPLFVSTGNISYTFADSIKTFQPKSLILPSTKDIAWEDLPADDPQRKINEAFHKSYFEHYKQHADYGPPVAYDGVMLVAEAIKKAGSTDPVKVKEAMESIQGYAGLVGVYAFSKDNHRGTGRKDTVLIQVKDGKFSLFWR